jgi:hypothetical protein
MPVALHSFKIDDDGKVRVEHIFYAETEEEAEEMLAAHAGGCRAFGPAVEHGNTAEIVEEIDVLPTPETVDEFVGGEDVDDDDAEEDER